MAKQTWNNPIDKTVDWGGDPSTGWAPVSGEMVQRFIKESFEKKAGEFYYDNTNNRYLVFADESARDAYLQDPTQTNLILGAFDAPFNYSAEITLHSKAYNAVFLNSTGNYLEFDFDIKNKQGASTGENVNITYTFIRNATRQTFTEVRKFGDSVRLNIDKYLGEGTNTITIGVTGQTSLAATTVAITYQVVNLTLEDNMDISKVYDLRNGEQILEVPFTVSGYGTKIVEWYLDGVLLPFVKAEDEVVDVIAERTKYITLSNLQQGTHSLQIRAYAVVNGEVFPTDTRYRDILVYTGVKSEVIMGIATTIPRENGVLGAEDSIAIYDMVQYVPYTLRFATYSPTNAATTEVEVLIDGVSKGVVNSANGAENLFTIISKTDGNKALRLEAGSIAKEMTAVVKKTDMNIEEIKTGLILDFNTEGKTNKSEGKDSWSFGAYTGSFSGFNWNNSSGWVNGRLEMNAGATFGIDIAPLDGSPASTGKTIEIEWSTKNVINDDAVICDLRGDNGVGILITATKVSMISEDGVVVETEYKSDENVRIGFVINKSIGSTNKRLSFIYANGVLSRAEQWAENDDYTSPKQMLFTSTDEAQVSLKSIRIYDTALSSDNMLNNYILYRDSIEDMVEVYDRNDVYEEGTTVFSPEKMMSRLPVMIVTGDIPTLENTSSKDTQIVVDIEYYNTQDPSRSFTMKNAAMRPQGTSSMGYPKKNFRIYTQKVAETILYDAEGKEVLDKLYAFKKGSQPVDCWCLKADYAESSGTHNTGIARLWNSALYNAQIGGEYKLRTEAQKIAAEEKYPYDVRTTIDGFPILMFYRKNPTDDLIFIGKYNFNNDKSTESVFGFKGIPNFNNEKMQCWEILNNGNALALFTTTEDFDTAWKDAFESRYPDTKTPYLGDLKAFSEWMVNVRQEDFATQKWEHFDVYKMAAYWVYLMRHAAADQFVKNAMFTSEDGQHFYFILYDNDTINGLINTGHLLLKPTDGRQTKNASGEYVFAGHDSRLWNMLEADKEFMTIVSEVDNALYSAGISYENTIRIFDEEQAEKWVEKVYNQDAQYKYVGPFVEKGIDNLFMLQGRRDLHRRWWLAKRFAIYDAKHVSGSYKSQAVEVKCINGTPAGQQFTIRAGYPLDYGYGINDVPREFGVTLEIGEYKQFTTKEVINRGDPVRIYAAPNIAEIDFSLMSDKLAVVNIANIYNEALGTKLTKLILGNSQKQNVEVSEISGLKQAKNLEYLDVQGMLGLTSVDLSEHIYLRTLKAFGSGISSATFANGAPIERLELPASLRVIVLNQLTGLTLDNLLFENNSGLSTINIKGTPNLTNDFGWVKSWYNNKTTADKSCSLIMDNVYWENVTPEDLIALTQFGTLSLKGKVVLTSLTVEQFNILIGVFGENAFNKNADFYIDAPAAIYINGRTEVSEGESEQYLAVVFGAEANSISWTIASGGNEFVTLSEDGFLAIEEGYGNGTIVIKTTIVTERETKYVETSVNVKALIYPTQDNTSLTGNSTLESEYETYRLVYPNDVTGSFSVSWSLTGFGEYASIHSESKTSCVIKSKRIVGLPLDGVLTCTLIKNNGNIELFTLTKGLRIVDENLAESDPEVCRILHEAGLTANVGFVTKAEAASITEDDFRKNGSSFFSIFTQNENIKSFDGFKYFTQFKVLMFSCFESCTNLKSIRLPSTLETLQGNCFYQSGLESIEIPESLTSLGRGVNFVSCNLSQIEIPQGVTSIPNGEFKGCLKLQSVRLPNALTSLGDECFSNCSQLKTITIPEGVTTLGASCFESCGLINIVLPQSMVELGGSCFGTCRQLQSVSINQGLQTIGANCFNRCSSLTEVIFPDSVTSLGESCFLYCSALRNVILPKTLEKLPKSGFQYCSQLETIVIQEVSYIDRYCFSGCLSLKNITCMAKMAPTTESNSFGGGTSEYVGRNTYNTGENKLYLSLDATGYESGVWLDPLQNSTKCGFTIYGKLKITATKSDAKFAVTYTTLANETNTVNVGVGTFYLGDVKYNTEMTITVTEGGKPQGGKTRVFVYSDSTNEQFFDFTLGSWIVIDESITDPLSMISGSVNSSEIQDIRNNTHRYLGKPTKNGVMTICQLSDSDSTYYHDGTPAYTNGSQGDVYVKLPHFCYKVENVSTNVWKIGFYYNPTGDPPEAGWTAWDGNTLIGAYEAHCTNNKAYSWSGFRSTGEIGQAQIKEYARNRGTGFQIVDWQMHCVMAILFYARYGRTNCRDTIGAGVNSSDKICGQTDTIGMNDTRGKNPKTGLNDTGADGNAQSINYWGLENWWGNKYEWIDNIMADNLVWKITELDGTVREATASSSNMFITKMLWGEHCDLIPTATGGSATTSYCELYWGSKNVNQIAMRSGSNNIDQGGVCFIYVAFGPNHLDGTMGSRLAFRGQCVEETNPATFKSLGTIG